MFGLHYDVFVCMDKESQGDRNRERDREQLDVVLFWLLNFFSGWMNCNSFSIGLNHSAMLLKHPLNGVELSRKENWIEVVEIEWGSEEKVKRRIIHKKECGPCSGTQDVTSEFTCSSYYGLMGIYFFSPIVTAQLYYIFRSLLSVMERLRFSLPDCEGWNVTTLFFPVATVWASGLRQNRPAKDTARGKLDCEMPLEYTSPSLKKNLQKL